VETSHKAVATFEMRQHSSTFPRRPKRQFCTKFVWKVGRWKVR